MRATDKQAYWAVACLVVREVQPQRVAQNVHCGKDGVRVVQGLSLTHEDNVGDRGCSRHSSWLSGKLQQGHEAVRMPPHRAGVLSCPRRMLVLGPAARAGHRGASTDTVWTAANAAAGPEGRVSRSSVEQYVDGSCDCMRV